MNAPTRPTISVTDHALVRYLERVHRLDIEAIREEVRAKVVEAVAKGIVYYDDGDLIFALAGHAVKTVYRKGEPA